MDIYFYDFILWGWGQRLIELSDFETIHVNYLGNPHSGKKSVPCSQQINHDQS